MTIRQRLRLRTGAAAGLAASLGVIFALVIFWYGLMTFLLAVKLSPHTVNSLSAYRTIYDWLARLTPHTVGVEPARWLVPVCGLVAFLVFGALAVAAIPRAHLTRHALELGDTPDGSTSLQPRAIERLAEIAVARDPAITSASGRLDDNELNVVITVDRARHVDQILRRARDRAAHALEQHDLPPLSINITLTRYDRRHKRELN